MCKHTWPIKLILILILILKKSLLNLFYLKWQKEQSIFRLSEEVVEWGQSNAVQSDWCWSQCVCVCVCVCGGGGGGSEGSVVHGVREGRGGTVGREFSFLTAWWLKLSFSLLVLAWRQRSLLPDGSRLKKLCDGWVGSPAMQRALRVRRVM